MISVASIASSVFLSWSSHALAYFAVRCFSANGATSYQPGATPQVTRRKIERGLKARPTPAPCATINPCEMMACVVHPREGEQWGGAKRAESDCGSHGTGGAGGVRIRVRLLSPWGEAWLTPGILRAGAGEEMRQSVWPS